MRVAVGSDHRGFHVKQRVLQLLRERHVEAVDGGPATADNIDYPDVAIPVAREVAAGRVDRAILICGTGLGMALAANKIVGVRATPVHDDITAELSRTHNDSNILCLSADLLGERLIDHIVDIWLSTGFHGARHLRRLRKIEAVERASPGAAANGDGS